jgi:3-oxoadipate enol-lactonase
MTTSLSTLALPGASVRYEVSGTGPAVVLVHGFGLDLRMWDDQVDVLSRDFTVVRHDCRGFGASGSFDPAVPYTHAGDIVALLDHLSIDRAAVVGLSFGGRVALQTALGAPGRVRAIAVLDAVVDGVPWDAESQAGMAEVARQVSAGGVAAGRSAWLAHPLFAEARADPVLAARLAKMVADYPGQHWLGLDPHEPDGHRVLESLGQITVPALVMVGERDVPGFLAMSDTLARRLPAAELVTVAGAGHMVNMEQPAQVTAALTDFLRRTAS